MTQTCTLYNTPTDRVLTELYADDERQRVAQPRPAAPPEGQTPLERFSAMKSQYMPIGRAFGNLLYTLIRAARPKTIVEFGTSFGISTIYLAAAVRDNGIGKIITTEFIAEKAEQAQQNLSAAGLVDWVEFRVGDALQTLLEPLPGPVEFLFLDGEKTMYLDILALLEPQMRSGSLIAADNTDHQGLQNFLDHVHNKNNGYVSCPIFTGAHGRHGGHEVSLRL